jgi:2-keto-3-deoxy-L-fuconate dehydrogenase
VQGESDGPAAVITGGASGIGLATALHLAERGARVACLDLRPDGLPEPLLGIAADVSDDATVRAGIETAAERPGGLDVLVNNAGIGAIGTVEANPDDEWHRVLDVNVGPVRVSRAALPHLRRSAHAGLPDRALYSASKGAMQSLTAAMAADHVREGIRVCCGNPGTVDTPWVRRLLAQAADPSAELPYEYGSAPAAAVARACAIAGVCRRHGTSLPAAALAFAASDPAITAVVVGAESPQQVRRNAGRAIAPPPGSLWPALREAGLL